MSDISLKSLIKEDNVITESVPGYPGFDVTISYPGRKGLSNLRKGCLTTKINRKTREVEEVLDEEKFLMKYVEAVIIGWKGFKVSYLQELALVDTEGLDPNDEVAFSVDNAYVLMDSSPIFDSWVTELSSDMENFTKS